MRSPEDWKALKITSRWCWQPIRYSFCLLFTKGCLAIISLSSDGELLPFMSCFKIKWTSAFLNNCGSSSRFCFLFSVPAERGSGSGEYIWRHLQKWNIKHPPSLHGEKMHYGTEWTWAPTPSWLSMFTCIDEAYLTWLCWTDSARWLKGAWQQRGMNSGVKNGTKK